MSLHGSSPPMQTAALDAAVQIEGVAKTFVSKDRTLVRALERVDLSITEGETLAIVGPSGCGKSTLLMTVAGLERPTTGHVTIQGELVTGPYDRMGIAFQRDNLLEWRTVRNNVLAQLDLRGTSRSGYEEKADMLLEMTGLKDFSSRYPRELSGGMRQRAALCRALVHEPVVLLLDEPFGAVDALTRERLNADVSRLLGRWTTTTIFVTHDIGEAVFMGSRVAVMSRRPGRIVGMVHVNLDRPRSQEVRKSPSYAAAVTEVRELLERTGAFSG